MSLRSAVVSTGVSDAVGSSKIAIRCGTVERAGDLRELALRDRQALRPARSPAPRRRTRASPRPRGGSSPGRRPSSPRRTSRPRNMFSAIDRSGASMISWCTSTMPRRSASTGPFSSTGAPSSLIDAAARREMAAEDLHQRRLAGAVLADDRVDLAGADADRHVAQDLDRPERARQPHRLENGLGRKRGCSRVLRRRPATDLRRVVASSLPLVGLGPAKPSWPSRRW